MSYRDSFSFYRSVEWNQFRDAFLSERVARDGELICEECGKVIVHKYDAILHHKIELTDSNVHDATVALNPSNIMVVCHKSHNKIHERFGYSGSRHIYVVWGSPCAEKSRYVAENAGKNDLVIDIDRLYEALGVDGNRGAVKGNVLSLYRSLVDMVKTRNGKWRSAWVVRTLPLRVDRDLIVRDLCGGELIHIDTAMAECLTEARVRGGDWEKWVKKYWEKFQADE